MAVLCRENLGGWSEERGVSSLVAVEKWRDSLKGLGMGIVDRNVLGT